MDGVRPLLLLSFCVPPSTDEVEMRMTVSSVSNEISNLQAACRLVQEHALCVFTLLLHAQPYHSTGSERQFPSLNVSSSPSQIDIMCFSLHLP